LIGCGGDTQIAGGTQFFKLTPVIKSINLAADGGIDGVRYEWRRFAGKQSP